MCGIYGEYFPNRTLSSKQSFEAINNLAQLRGPDSTGYWTDKKDCQLGFRRLAIIDLSSDGNQPMVSLNGRWIMVFNGEIYNYLELKEELLHANYKFKGHSDSEVLVNCFEHFGIESTLDKIDGMFAIALFDTLDKSLYLIRDFAGIKPLFYGLHNGNLVFGSQYNQIVTNDLIDETKLDLEVLKLYLRMHYMPAPYGIIKNTFQVEPGQVVKISKDQKIQKWLYWQFPDLDELSLVTNQEEALDLIATSLEESVEKEMMSDVPLGSFLSGGIDSPLITYYTTKYKKDTIAYTMGSDSKKHDESKDAGVYAKAIGCNFILDKMTSVNASEILETSTSQLYEPFADFSLIPTFNIAKSAKTNCTVMLSGDGGDELFFGYNRFRSILKNFPYRNWPLKYLWYGLDRLFFKNTHLNGNLLASSFGKAHQNLHSRTSENTIHRIFPKLSGLVMKEMDCYKYSDGKNKLALLHAMRKAEFYGMMQKTLTKVDRMSMANSMEVRVPFLSKSFVETALKIHPNLSYGKTKKKDILKILLRKLIHQSPIDNRKRGFSIPLTQWLKEDLKNPVRHQIFNELFINAFNISSSELKLIWEEHQNGIKDHKWLIFSLYSLAIWFRNLKK